MKYAGLLKKGEWLLMIQLLLFCCVIYVADASVPYGLLKAPSVSPISSPLAAPTRVNHPLPVNVRHFMLRGAPMALSPADPPLYGPLITAGNPPTTSQLSKPSMESSAVAPPLAGFKSIAPQSNAGTIPPGLAKPPISPSSSSKSHIWLYPYFRLSHFLWIQLRWILHDERNGIIFPLLISYIYV